MTKAPYQYHRLLDNLCAQGVYGAVIFHFVKGDITLVKNQLEFNDKQVIKKVIVIQRKVEKPAITEDMGKNKENA
jgi:hypothetical protein